MWHITVNSTCEGQGRCIGIAPLRFAPNEENRAYPINEVIEPDDAVLRAVASCPMAAIEVVEVESGQPPASHP